MTSEAGRLSRTPLPAMAFDRDGSFFIVARAEEDKVLVHDPREGRPRVMPQSDLEARWTEELVLFASRASIAGELARFDCTWFIPAVVKYRKLLGEVLRDVSFTIEPGTVVGIVGRSGSGKSTLTRLIQRLPEADRALCLVLLLSRFPRRGLYSHVSLG